MGISLHFVWWQGQSDQSKVIFRGHNWRKVVSMIIFDICAKSLVYFDWKVFTEGFKGSFESGSGRIILGLAWIILQWDWCLNSSIYSWTTGHQTATSINPMIDRHTCNEVVHLGSWWLEARFRMRGDYSGLYPKTLQRKRTRVAQRGAFEVEPDALVWTPGGCRPIIYIIMWRSTTLSYLVCIGSGLVPKTKCFLGMIGLKHFRLG